MINRIIGVFAAALITLATTAHAAEPGNISVDAGVGPSIMLWAETSGSSTERGSNAALHSFFRVGYGLSDRLELLAVVEETVFRLAYDQRYSDGTTDSTSATWVNGFYGVGVKRYTSRFVDTTYVMGAVGWGTLSVPFEWSSYRNYSGPAVSGAAGYTFPDKWGIEVGTSAMGLSAQNKGTGDMIIVNVNANAFWTF